MSYCTECILRTERKYKNKKNEIDFSQEPVKPIVTNKSGFCNSGYTQNPITHEATKNVIKNGGIVCENNPYLKQKAKKYD